MCVCVCVCEHEGVCVCVCVWVCMCAHTCVVDENKVTYLLTYYVFIYLLLYFASFSTPWCDKAALSLSLWWWYVHCPLPYIVAWTRLGVYCLDNICLLMCCGCAMYICTYVCVSIRECVCVCVLCTYVCVHTCMCICMQVLCTCTYVCVRACIHLCLQAGTHTIPQVQYLNVKYSIWNG